MNLNSADQRAVELREDLKCDRLAPMKRCPACVGGEVYDPEERFQVGACPRCEGRGEFEDWTGGDSAE